MMRAGEVDAHGAGAQRRDVVAGRDDAGLAALDHSRPNGAAPKPTSTCLVMVCVMVAAMLPVDVGFAVR